MGASEPRRRGPFRIARSTAVVTTAVLAVVVATVAAAASLGGVSAGDLFATQKVSSPSVPSMLIRDFFTGTGDLDGHVPETGPPWTVRSGTWTLIGGGLLDVNAGTNRWASIDAGVTDVTARVGVMPSGGHDIGLVLRASPSATTYLRLMKSNNSGGRLRLQRVVSGSVSTLETLNGVGNSPGVLTVSISGAAITATFGSSTLTHTLSPANQATFGSFTRVGVAASSSNDDRFSAPFSVSAP